jgi:gluconate 2-dehydrogenase gamma chain
MSDLDTSPPVWSLFDSERATLAAISERIFPAGPSSPGALEIGVVDGIERQLATAWGGGDGLYRQPPFETPDHGGHGWQSPMTPRETYRYALGALDDYCERTHGAGFASLAAETQDEVLVLMESGRLGTFAELSSDACFAMIHANILEGLFADPAHGGNRDLLGWRWLGHPGPQAAHGVDFGELIEATERYAPEPVALPPVPRDP